MMWILGEYADLIDNSTELLQNFLEGFSSETAQVQQQLLTAIVKLFLKQPGEEEKAMVQAVLQQATSSFDYPDLRDKAYIYWRLLSSDPEAAKLVVLAQRPPVSEDTSKMPLPLLDTLVWLSSLSCIPHLCYPTLIAFCLFKSLSVLEPIKLVFSASSSA